MAARAQIAPSYVRLAGYATLGFLFALPCVTGRLTTYFVLICGLLMLLTPSVIAARRAASRSSVDAVFAGVVLALAVALTITAEDGSDVLYVFNFVAFLLAIPFRWQLEPLARRDGAVIIAWLSLAGTVAAAGLAIIQVFMLGYDRVGQPVLSAFHYANTTMLLGFFALVGWAAPGNHRRWPFLLGPVIAVASVLLSGTRGALLAAPLLALVVFVFALVTARRKAPILLAALAGVVVLGGLLLAAPYLGFGRALQAFSVSTNVLTGGAVDTNTIERLQMVTGGWQAFLASPLFGYGWRDMVTATLPYVDPAYAPAIDGYKHLHNGFISFAAGAGLVGILCFLVLSVIPVVAVLQSPRDSQFTSRLYLAVTMCVGYAVFQLTFLLIGFEFHTVQYAFMTMVILAFVRDPVPNGAQSAEGNASVGSETMKTV